MEQDPDLLLVLVSLPTERGQGRGHKWCSDGIWWPHKNSPGEQKKCWALPTSCVVTGKILITQVPEGISWKSSFNTKKCMKVLLQRCEEERKPTENSKGTGISRKSSTSQVWMGQDGGKRLLGNGGRCRCRGKATKSNVAIEEHGNYQHHSDSDKP